MKLYNSITGKWSDYIPGGIVGGCNRGSGMMVLPKVEKLLRREDVASMVRDFIKRNPNRKDEALKEWGDVISKLK